MKLTSISVFSMLLLLSACKGQKEAPNSLVESADHVVKLAIGDTVLKIHESIGCVFQDSRDKYWFGSNGQGVFQYDGQHLIQFTTEDGLTHNQIREIQEDKQGYIYFTTGDGISKFDGQSFTTLKPVKDPRLNPVWKREPNDLWFRGMPGQNGPFRYDGTSLYSLAFPKHYLEDEFYAQYPQAPFSPYEVYTIYEDKSGDLWFGTSNFGLCRFNGKTLSWMYEEHLTIKGGGSFGIRSIIEDTAGYFWICNTRYRFEVFPEDTLKEGMHFLRYKRKSGVSNPAANLEVDVPYFLSAVEDDRGDLWLASYEEGVWRYDGTELLHFPVIQGNSNVNVFSISKDNHGQLWLGTTQNGAYHFDGQGFKPFIPNLKGDKE